MSSKLAIAAIALWGVTIAVGGAMFMKGSTAPSSDGRTAILLAPAERDFVLSEMRGMLAAVQSVSAAIAAEDGSKAVSAARAVGAETAVIMPVSLMSKLPMEFKHWGMEMHGGFNRIADAAEGGASPSVLAGMLTAQLDACLGCHHNYRIDPVR